MPAPVRTPDTAPPLVFEWKRERGVKRRLAMWLLMVAAALAAMFYLFRVAPPVASRQPLPQQAVLYLPAGEPEVQALLGKISDRIPGAMLRSGGGSTAVELEALAKVTPAWEPTWAAHRAALKPFPLQPVPQELPPLFTAGATMLPEEEIASTLPPLEKKVKPSPYVSVDTTAGGRRIVTLAAWPEELTDETWPVSGTLPFVLALDRHGRVQYCLAVSAATGVNLEAIRRVLTAMRFNSVPAGGLEWVNVAVRW